MMYAVETWPAKRTQQKKLDVAEMKMLRWMCSVTRVRRIRDEIIRETNQHEDRRYQRRRIKEETAMVRTCDEERCVGRRVTEVDVLGRRSRGRPKRRWMDCVRENLREKQLSEGRCQVEELKGM